MANTKKVHFTVYLEPETVDLMKEMGFDTRSRGMNEVVKTLAIVRAKLVNILKKRKRPLPTPVLPDTPTPLADMVVLLEHVVESGDVM